MLKDMPKIHYTFEDGQVTLKKLFKLLRKRPGRDKVVCFRYLILEIGKKTTADPMTLGTLFYATCDEVRQASFTEALALLLKLLEQTLKTVVGFSKEQVQHLVQQFIESSRSVSKYFALIP